MRTSSTSSRSARAPSPGFGPASCAEAVLRWSPSADSERANTASVIAVSGTPSSSASCAVQRPVPFCSAWSRMTSTSGWPGPRVGLVEHGRGDLDQERVEVALVPLVEDLRDLRHLEPDAVAQQVVGLGDQLDVGVLDAVVDHLHVVARAVGADVGAARRAVDLGGDRGEDVLDVVVGLARAAGHDARPVQRALLAAGHADAEEAQAALVHRLVAALGVAEVRVAAVDDRVALVEQRRELLDHRVDRRAGLDHGHDRPRALERLRRTPPSCRCR